MREFLLPDVTRGVDFSRPGITHIRTIDISKCMDIYAHDIKWNLLNPALWCLTDCMALTVLAVLQGGCAREGTLGVWDRGLRRELMGPRGGFGTELLCIGSLQAVELLCAPLSQGASSQQLWLGGMGRGLGSG